MPAKGTVARLVIDNRGGDGGDGGTGGTGGVGGGSICGTPIGQKPFDGGTGGEGGRGGDGGHGGYPGTVRLIAFDGGNSYILTAGTQHGAYVNGNFVNATPTVSISNDGGLTRVEISIVTGPSRGGAPGDGGPGGVGGDQGKTRSCIIFGICDVHGGGPGNRGHDGYYGRGWYPEPASSESQLHEYCDSPVDKDGKPIVGCRPVN